MKRTLTLVETPLTKRLVQGLFLCTALALVAPVLAGDDEGDDEHGVRAGLCTQTAQAALRACRHSARDDFWVAIGNCDNLPEIAARKACKRSAYSAQAEATEECGSQFEARKDVCAALGEDPYDPVINPADFPDSTKVSNMYFPLEPGTTFTYRDKLAKQKIIVRVTHKTKEILGVPCVVVRDTVREDGQIIEDTEDYYAQDRLGNVWYFGELSKTFEDGELVSLEGSWQAGRNAKPGIIMKAAPQVGETYRQEFFLGDAEDVAQVLSLTGTADVPAPGTSCTNTCLVTKDFSPLEPDVFEHKFYAPGVGLILEVDPQTGEQTKLVKIVHE